MATCAELAVWKAEAEAARHKLALGTAVVRVRQAGDEVEFRAADIDKLARYIAYLDDQLANCDGRNRRRIFGVIPT